GDNQQHPLLLDFLRQADPDVFAVLELRPAWAAVLQPLHAAYPHRRVLPRDDNFRLALYSRLPFGGVEVLAWAAIGVSSVVATVLTPGGDVKLLATHPVPPISSGTAAERDRQLAALAAHARGRRGPLVVMGDLNATPCSAPLRRL